MTSKQVEAQVLMSLENAASIGRSQQDYRDYCKRLTRGLMAAIEKYKETEIGKVIETVEE